MALSSPALPYGLRDVKLRSMDSSGNLGPPVDLPASQTFSFSEAEEFTTLRGDDRDVAIRGQGPKVEWDLEAGGISLEAWQVLTGGTVVDAGVTPNQTKTFTKKTTESRPYFMAEGQSINDNDGDTHLKLFKAKVTDNIEGEFADGEFFVTSCSGEAIGNEDDDLYEIKWNETATAIAGSSGLNEIQQVISNATGGTFTLDFSGQDTSAIAYNATPAAVTAALEALSNIDPGEVTVSGSPGNWVIEFVEGLGQQDVALLVADGTSLTGGGIVVMLIQDGTAP